MKYNKNIRVTLFSPTKNIYIQRVTFSRLYLYKNWREKKMRTELYMFSTIKEKKGIYNMTQLQVNLIGFKKEFIFILRESHR